MNIDEKEGNYKVIFDSLERFYSECDIVEDTGYKSGYAYCPWDECNDRNEPSWVGLSKEEILKSKYSYKKGLDELKSLEEDFDLGGTKRCYKWDETDGDDMNYERFIDELPAMKKRIRKQGDSQGKIINLHVSVGENCNIRFDEMLNRSYTVMRLVDYLENLNFRVGIYVYSDVSDLGKYKGNSIKHLHTEIQIKKPEEPLIKSLILTCISPWMLRYHLFKFWTAKFKCHDNLGHSISTYYPNTKTDIYFPTRSCLNDKDSKQFLKDLLKEFNYEEQYIH